MRAHPAAATVLCCLSSALTEKKKNRIIIVYLLFISQVKRFQMLPLVCCVQFQQVIEVCG